MAKIALITRDEALAGIISDILKGEKHEVTRLPEYSKEVATRTSDGFDVVIMNDVGIKHTGKFIRHSSPKLIIIFDEDVTSRDLVEIQISNGVWDCIPKPLLHGGKFIESTVEDVKDNLLNSIREAVRANTQEYDISGLDRTEIIGESQAIKSCLASLNRAIKSDQSILLMGDTGTGKELFAKVVHNNSPRRKKKRFVAFNCAAIPETLAEAILFGVKKGLFTDGIMDKDGLVKQANEGTLFLDEVGELSPGNQTKLLRCIETKEVLPLGAAAPESANFRLVAATNENIGGMIKKRKFRQDLYFRIGAFPIFIPPLKDRKEDIKAIADHYIKTICDKNEFPTVKEYTADFMEALNLYDWPGNVRELINEIHGSIFKSGNASFMNVYHLSANIRAFWAAYSMSRQFDIPQATRDAIGEEYLDGQFVKDMTGHTVSIKFIPGQTPPLNECKDKLELEYLRQLKKGVDEKLMTVEKASELLGLSIASYHRLLNKHGLRE